MLKRKINERDLTKNSHLNAYDICKQIEKRMEEEKLCEKRENGWRDGRGMEGWKIDGGMEEGWRDGRGMEG